MEEKKRKLTSREKTLLVIMTIAIICGLAFGISYAYFLAQDQSDVQTVDVGTLKVTYTQGDTMNMSELYPIESEDINSKAAQIDFAITNESTISSLFNIGLKDITIGDGLKDSNFKWRLMEGNSILSEGSFASIGDNTTLSLKKNLEIEQGVSNAENYKLLVWIEENYDNQNSMMGQNFKATIVVSSAIKNEGWNSAKQVNAPVLADGMIPVKWNDTKQKWIICSETDPEWYNYVNQDGDNGESIWANVMLNDHNLSDTSIGTEVSIEETGSMFVWIPRYEYRLDSTNRTIDVKFIPTSQTTVDDDYTYIHPAFTTNIQNGGWDSHLSGIWVAKYAAGYQASTVANDVANPANKTDEIVYSDYYYTGQTSDNNNPIGQNLSLDDYSTYKVSYPVFKAGTYAYNLMNVNDMYLVSQDIDDAYEFYGLNLTDSHLIKNSEWGAVAYLAWSSYGRNGQSVTINGKDAGQSAIFAHAITGYTGAGTEAEPAIKAVSNDTAASSTTKNMSGVFDMVGCLSQRTAGYVANGDPALTINGASFASLTKFDEGGDTSLNTKYVNVYDYATDAEQKNWSAHYGGYKFYKEWVYADADNPKRYGEAMLEVWYDRNDTENVGATIDALRTWDEITTNMPYKESGKATGQSFFVRSSRFDVISKDRTRYDSIFSTAHNSGASESDKVGFRVVLVTQ